jgi:hypothetical protein
MLCVKTNDFESVSYTLCILPHIGMVNLVIYVKIVTNYDDYIDCERHRIYV